MGERGAKARNSLLCRFFISHRYNYLLQTGFDMTKRPRHSARAPVPYLPFEIKSLIVDALGRERNLSALIALRSTNAQFSSLTRKYIYQVSRFSYVAHSQSLTAIIACRLSHKVTPRSRSIRYINRAFLWHLLSIGRTQANRRGILFNTASQTEIGLFTRMG